MLKRCLLLIVSLVISIVITVVIHYVYTDWCQNKIYSEFSASDILSIVIGICSLIVGWAIYNAQEKQNEQMQNQYDKDTEKQHAYHECSLELEIVHIKNEIKKSLTAGLRNIYKECIVDKRAPISEFEFTIQDNDVVGTIEFPANVYVFNSKTAKSDDYLATTLKTMPSANFKCTKEQNIHKMKKGDSVNLAKLDDTEDMYWYFCFKGAKWTNIKIPVLNTDNDKYNAMDTDCKFNLIIELKMKYKSNIDNKRAQYEILDINNIIYLVSE